ncbi:MAG: phosphotransferase [Anaerolineae bacterium]|nr:phosphotransferase [Anaerolineae bacterium]
MDRWAARPEMRAFTPAFIHGDATTANFIFPWGGGVVGIDWERFKTADPAADLGRLMAEVAHSIKQHGGSVAEAVPDVQHVVDSYCRLLPPGWDADALVERARFYRAASTLRIARNGWVPRLDRTALVAQASALLADGR